jgi:predicted RNA binding protein YcfA (HicA-like mRNA interferase family)
VLSLSVPAPGRAVSSRETIQAGSIRFSNLGSRTSTGVSRLPTLHPTKLIRALKKAGFVELEQKGSHLTLFNSETNRQTTVAIHGRDVKRGLMKEILRQAGISEEQFRRLI